MPLATSSLSVQRRSEPERSVLFLTPAFFDDSLDRFPFSSTESPQTHSSETFAREPLPISLQQSERELSLRSGKSKLDHYVHSSERGLATLAEGISELSVTICRRHEPGITPISRERPSKSRRFKSIQVLQVCSLSNPLSPFLLRSIVCLYYSLLRPSVQLRKNLAKLLLLRFFSCFPFHPYFCTRTAPSLASVCYSRSSQNVHRK